MTAPSRRRPPRPALVAAALAAVLLIVGLVLWIRSDAGDDTAASTTTTTTAADATAPTSDPDASTTTTSTPEPTGCDPAATIASWPLETRLAALIVVGVDPSGTADATSAVEDHHVGGLFVGGNDTTLLTSGVLDDLRAASPLGLIVSVDEEGGRVQRIEGIDGDVPSARDMAATMTPEAVGDLARRRARVMAGLGVDVDLAPVVDVSDQADGTVIGDRSWSDDPDTVVEYAAAYADGLLAEGIVPVLKHFPGHGSASGDTHQGAATTPPLADLTDHDLVPYAALLPRFGPRVGVMLGHLDVPGLTEPDTPASISPAAVELLRDTYGFTGAILTDDLSGMAAVTDRMTPSEAAIRALEAGVDLVLFADADVAALITDMTAAVEAGRLPATRVDEAVAHSLDLKGVDPCTVAL